MDGQFVGDYMQQQVLEEDYVNNSELVFQGVLIVKVCHSRGKRRQIQLETVLNFKHL